jgi:heme exporter protein CcmB
MSSAFAALYARDLRLALRRRVEALLPLMFFVVAISLFPLGVGPEPDRLREIAAGIVWVSALLAAMLSVSSLYAGDLADGSLEQMLLSGQPGALIAGAKAAAHWTVTGAPLVLAAPLIGLLLDMSLPALGTLVVSLLLGTPILSLLGGLGAAGRPVHGLLRRADRRHAGRFLPDHLRARAGGMDVDGAVPGDGLLGRGGLGSSMPGWPRWWRARWRPPAPCSPFWRCGPAPVGQADLGHLVGLGRPADVGTNPAVPVSGIHGPGGID